MKTIKKISLFSSIDNEEMVVWMTLEKCGCGCGKDVYRINEKQKNRKTVGEGIILDESSYKSIEEPWSERLRELINNGWSTERAEAISENDSIVSSEQERQKALERLRSN